MCEQTWVIEYGYFNLLISFKMSELFLFKYLFRTKWYLETFITLYTKVQFTFYIFVTYRICTILCYTKL